MRVCHLPPQLQKLTMTLFLNDEDHPLINLSHITGLTRLDASGGESAGDNGWVVGLHAAAYGGPNDKLPPNCRHL
jgi:hypothetical protein